MPTIGFWNLAQRTPVSAVVDLLAENGIEILVISEESFSPPELIVRYAEKTTFSLYSQRVITSRIRFFSNFPENVFRPVFEDPYISIKEYRPAIGEPILIVGAHLPSKLWEGESDQAYQGTRLIGRVQDAEHQVGHDRTVVIGDLNMNPFDPGIVSSEGMHGVMDRRIAQRRSRTVKEVKRKFFYNPMWRVLGNGEAGVFGTYYRGSGSYVHRFWETFDQVLIRPNLLDEFNDHNLRIVHRIGKQDLASTDKIGINKRLSDHLPIVFSLRRKL